MCFHLKMEEVMYENFLRDIKDIQSVHDFLDIQNRNTLPKRYYNPLSQLNEREFMTKYRFTKENVRRIIDLIRDDLDTDRDISTSIYKRPQVPLDNQILIALRLWGTGYSLLTAFEHGITARTLAKICKRISGALASKSSFHIRMPATLSEKEATIHSFQSLPGNGSKLTNVIGAVNHHVCAYRRQNENCANKIEYIEEKIQIQLVSDAYCKIRDIDCKIRPLNVSNDANEIFKQSRIKERMEQNEFRGRILLADEGLRCTSYLFTPVASPKNRSEQSYNQVHFATFAPAKQCLKLWKKRFPILESEIASNFHTARNTIISTAVLHNLAIDWHDPTLDWTAEEETNGLTEYSTLRSSDTNFRSEFIKSNF